MGRGEGEALLDGGVLHDGLLDLEGGDRLAPAVNDLLGSTRNEQVALLVEMAHVAGVEPARLAVHDEERLLVRTAVVLVPNNKAKRPTERTRSK